MSWRRRASARLDLSPIDLGGRLDGDPQLLDHLTIQLGIIGLDGEAGGIGMPASPKLLGHPRDIDPIL